MWMYMYILLVDKTKSSIHIFWRQNFQKKYFNSQSCVLYYSYCFIISSVFLCIFVYLNEENELGTMKIRPKRPLSFVHGNDTYRINFMMSIH